MALKLLLLIALVASILVATKVYTVVSYIRGVDLQQTRAEKEFIQACTDLNGNQLSFETIQHLNGACAYLATDGGVGVEPCTEHHVQQYVQDKKAGKFIPYGDGSFAIWQKDDLNDVWICKITTFEPVIKAETEYYTD